MNKEKTYLTTSECANQTGLKTPKIRELFADGKIEGYKTKSNNYYYKNLIRVTSDEHKELHKLFNKDKKAYNQRIQEIQKENARRLNGQDRV